MYKSTLKGKKWQATHIAPLQPLVLAAFLPWGSSAGAGRARPAAAKIRIEQLKMHFLFLSNKINE